jgi:hypothetical protein
MIMPRLVKKKRRGSGFNLTRTDIRELVLYASNDRGLRNRRINPFAKNYAKKRVAGTYNKRKAIQGLANNLVPDILKTYGKEFGKLPSVSSAGKKKLGQAMLPLILRLSRENYEPALRKKKKKKKR